jgi:hypothetical protein
LVACFFLLQFDNIDVTEHLWPMVRSKDHIKEVLDGIEKKPGFVLYTNVNEYL